jgi:hypothetical protein
MPLHYANLDDETRRYMLKEFDDDVSNGRLYISPRLSAKGREEYPTHLREALEQHDDAWLAGQIRGRELLNAQEPRRTPSGGQTMVKVPVTAPETMAEGEFNRFYCRGLCARVTSSGQGEVEVYRGQQSARPRPESEALIGRRLDAEVVLRDLRSSVGVEPALGVPPGPNSGLTLRIP